MKLHPALRPWEALLGEIAPELEGVLAAWLPRLAALVGPVRHAADPEVGEPDGYSGFARRGPPDRLILSEWAMREVHPDEFIRRAVDGELLYLDPARRAPTAARRALVLFDTGPEQLGAARLVHLALLVVLGHRARSGGGTLSWSALPSGGLIQTLRLPGDLGLLSNSRSWKPGPWSADEWVERIGDIDDLFVVGGPAARALSEALGGRFIGVDEVEETLVVQAGRGRTARLPLIDRDAAARAVHAPLGGTDAPATDHKPPLRRGWFDALPRTLLFSPSGGHLIVELQTGRELIAVPIGKRGRKGFRPKRLYLHGDQPVAATVYKRGLLAVTERDGQLRMHGTGGGHAPVFDRNPGDTGAVSPLSVDGSHVLFVDGRRRGSATLHSWARQSCETVSPSEVLAFARGARGPRVLGLEPDGALVLVDYVDPGSGTVERIVVDSNGATQAVLGPLGSKGWPVAAAAVGHRNADGAWFVGRYPLWERDAQTGLPVAVDEQAEEVVGVAEFAEHGLPVALVLIVFGETVVARGPEGEVTLLTLPMPALNRSLCAAKPQLAVARPDGRIHVYDLLTGEIVLEIGPEAGR